MKHTLSALIITALVLAISSPASPHHGTAAYDNATLTTVKGTVTNFQFANPHVQVSFDVNDDQGKIQNWQGEITSPSQLARAGGWNKNSLKPGDQVTISGNRAKNGSYTMVIKKVFLNGEELKISGDANN